MAAKTLNCWDVPKLRWVWGVKGFLQYARLHSTAMDWDGLGWIEIDCDRQEFGFEEGGRWGSAQAELTSGRGGWLRVRRREPSR